jgi:hypothetical protein
MRRFLLCLPIALLSLPSLSATEAISRLDLCPALYFDGSWGLYPSGLAFSFELSDSCGTGLGAGCALAYSSARGFGLDILGSWRALLLGSQAGLTLSLGLGLSGGLAFYVLGHGLAECFGLELGLEARFPLFPKAGILIGLALAYQGLLEYGSYYDSLVLPLRLGFWSLV